MGGREGRKGKEKRLRKDLKKTRRGGGREGKEVKEG